MKIAEPDEFWWKCTTVQCPKYVREKNINQVSSSSFCMDRKSHLNQLFISNQSILKRDIVLPVLRSNVTIFFFSFFPFYLIFAKSNIKSSESEMRKKATFCTVPISLFTLSCSHRSSLTRILKSAPRSSQGQLYDGSELACLQWRIWLFFT